MWKSKGNIEILLLLCCLVGVVSFFCFGLGITSLLLQPSEKPELQEKLDALLKEKEERKALLERLGDDKRELIGEKEKHLKVRAEPDNFNEAQQRELEQELKKLNEERDRLNQEIMKRRKEFTHLQKIPDPEKREEKEREFRELERQHEQLEKKIREKTELLAQVDAGTTMKPPLGKETNLRNTLYKFREKRRRLETELKSLKTRTLWGGRSQFKNPLFIDCRGDVYTFYPDAETVAVAQIDERNTLELKAKGHDIVVLLVRPEGYESFKKAYEKVKTWSVARSYEPIKAEEDLGFLREKNEK
jgi:hypothetical protein